jgi:hypothetical protein
MGLGRTGVAQKIVRLPAHREGALWERGGGVSGSEETFSSPTDRTAAAVMNEIQVLCGEVEALRGMHASKGVQPDR